MPAFKLPLSGNVTQTINPWTMIFSPTTQQVGEVNINLGNSSNPPAEEQILTDVASYGKQLGRIEDVLLILLEHFQPTRKLTAAEDKSIEALKRMLADIADVKGRHTEK